MDLNDGYVLLSAIPHCRADLVDDRLEQPGIMPIAFVFAVKKRQPGLPIDQQGLAKRMRPGIAGEVLVFLRDYDGTPPAEALRRPWLEQLAENGRWKRFAEDYRPQSDENLQCLYGQVLLNSGRRLILGGKT